MHCYEESNHNGQKGLTIHIVKKFRSVKKDDRYDNFESLAESRHWRVMPAFSLALQEVSGIRALTG